MDVERQKKIEAGRRKVDELKKRRHKKSKDSPDKSKDVPDKSNSACSLDSISHKSTDDEPEAAYSSSNNSINNVKGKSEVARSEMTCPNSNRESALLIPEDVSDDADSLLDTKDTLVSCFEQKIVKYQEVFKQKDLMIQQLSQQLASAMSATEAADLARTQVEENLRTEINKLHLQMKQAVEMIAKQNSKSENKESIQESDTCDKNPHVYETGVQVEILCERNNKNYASVQTDPTITSETAENKESGNEGTKAHQNESIHNAFSVAKKIESLSVITKLIESHVNISLQSIDESSDFSPSKFQSFFLKRLNSVETEVEQIDTLDNESPVSNINYAEVGDESFVRNGTEFPSVEKPRNRIVPKDFSLLTDFLFSEIESINLSLHSLKAGPQGDCDILGLTESVGPTVTPETTSITDRPVVNSDLNEVLQRKSKLELKIIQLKQLGKELKDAPPSSQKSVESDALTTLEDNLIMEEPPLSCVSLLSLTDSEYKTDYIMTDSEANVSRKVSVDSSRPAQDVEFCPKCDRYFELIKEKYDDHMCILKETIENNLILEKNEAVKKLESEIDKMKLEKETMHTEMVKQIELLCQEQEMKIQHIINGHHKQLTQLQDYQSKWNIEKNNLVLKINDLELRLTQTNAELQEACNEKANIQFSLQKQIADLVEEHQEDLEARNLANSEQFSQERKKLESENLSSLDVHKKLHEDKLEDLRKLHAKELKDREMCLKKEHSGAIALLEANHFDECDTYQKKIEHLLEEKCELLTKTTHEYEAILKKNHKALVNLCNQLRSKLFTQKKKIVDESCRSGNGDLDVSVSDALDELNKSIEDGIVKFLDQNYFSANDYQEMMEETQYLSFETMPTTFKQSKKLSNGKQAKKIDMKQEQGEGESSTHSSATLQDEDLQLKYAETLKLQHEFQKDVAMYMEVNEQLHRDMQLLETQNEEFLDRNKKLESQLLEREKELATKETQLTSIDSGSVNDVAQTNSRLLHVLSDLVKTFLDIEQEINRHLYEHGLVPPRSNALGQHDDETGHSVGSREDFASLSIGECPNLELAEDGPDLTPRAWDLFSAVGTYDHEVEGEDVVLGASRRLRMAVDHVLNLLTRALDNQQNQDLKLLLKRNEELSQELQEESKGRDAVHMDLVTAESVIRKLEGEKLRLEDVIADLRDNQDLLKREITIEKNKITYLSQEKEAANDEVQTLRNQCDLLASRLGDPERLSTNIMLNSQVTHVHEKRELLEENSRLSSEKHNVQTNLSKARQSFLDRMQQMEIALDNLNAEKEELMENKCKEIRDLKAEMEAMEKQLQSNKKFIEEQAQEREQEREDYLKELNKMQEVVREKEKIQSNEGQLLKEIESLEQVLRTRIEDHQTLMQKKDAVENELRQSVDKINDLREIIEELEKQLNMKAKVELELRQKLSYLTETVNAQERRNSLLDDEITLSKNVSSTRTESTEQVQNLKEQLACQSQEIEEMSQSQTLLQELRGQIHFLEAKVEQRAKQLESMQLFSNSPVQSADASPSSSQENESIHLPCEDGWEMSPRSIHWLEVRRLEEKIGRLAHIDEELIRKNKELEQKLKRLQHIHTECEQENSALQEKLSEQLMQVSALKSHIDEQKHRSVTPHKTQAISKKLEELQEAYNAQLENNKQLLSELHESRDLCLTIKEEMEKKDNLINSLQRNIHSALKEKEELRTESSCRKLLLLEKQEELNLMTQAMENLQSTELQNNDLVLSEVKKQLEEKIKMTETLEQENSQLKSEVEMLKKDIQSLRELLESSKKQINSEQAQVEALYEELSNISHEKVSKGFSPTKSELGENSVEMANLRVANKLISSQNQLREKNLEISMLKDSIGKLEASLRTSERNLSFEKVQVDILFEEIGSLTSYQKRLEEDLDIIQNMMQQKERELATLHEETDAQMKLEAEVETLNQELDTQRDIEKEIRCRLHELESALETSKNLKKHEADQWKLRTSDLEKSHQLEMEKLKKQLLNIKKCSSKDISEDIDISEIRNEIMESMKVYSLENSSERKEYEDLVYSLLKKTVDSKLHQMQTKYEADINCINESWQQKIEKELGNKNDLYMRCEKYKEDCQLLQERLKKEADKICSNRDTYWQSKLVEMKISLKGDLSERHAKELKCLQDNLEQLSKDKILSEMEAKNLYREVEQLNESLKNQKEKIFKEFQSKIPVIEQKLKERLEIDWLQKEKDLKEEIEKVQQKFDSAITRGNMQELKHKEEIAGLNELFKTRWSDEMRKIATLQMEELKKLNNNKERNFEAIYNHMIQDYVEKLDKLQKKWEDERKLWDSNYKASLQEIQQAFENKYEEEKRDVLLRKEKELTALTEALKEKKRELSDLKSNMQSNGMKVWEEERQRLISLHEKQITELKQKLHLRYEKLLQNQLQERDADMRRVEETYSQRLEEVSELLKIAKQAAAGSIHSDSGSNRTATPSSEITSSDEACSSCQEDMLVGNKHLLVNKIHQDGKRILNLLESSSLHPSLKREAHVWLEERNWIVDRLRSLTDNDVPEQINLKSAINNLCDEICNSRKGINVFNEEIMTLRQKCSQLEAKVKEDNSKLCILTTNLNHQIYMNAELDSLLASRTNETVELRRTLKENRTTNLDSPSRNYSQEYTNSTSSSHDVGHLRAADEPRSAEKFSMFLPEIGSSPSLKLNKTTEEICSENMKSLLEFTDELLMSPEEADFPINDIVQFKQQNSCVHQELSPLLEENGMFTNLETKIHGLYWVYRKYLSFNRSLRYQKKYLLMLLRGFQITENLTLARVNQMTKNIPGAAESSDSSFNVGQPLRGYSHFRSIAFVVIAIERMKFCVRRWRLFARVPASEIVSAEVQSVFRSLPHATITPGGFNFSFLSLSSKSASIYESEQVHNVLNSASSVNSRTETKSKIASLDSGKLNDIMQRLTILHKQLGLDNQR